jgi:hypothetical protein
MSDQGKPRRSIDPAVTIEEPATRTALEDLLDAPVARRVTAPAGGCLIASCVEERHPTLQGRVQVQLTDADGHAQTLWVPTLQGLPVRKADRVLMVRPGNGDEWIVTGIVDGFARRPDVAKVPAARLELKTDECVQVVSSAGQPLVEVSQGSAGPVVRLLEPDVRVEFAGKLVLRAEGIEFEATRGQVAIKASEDVVIKGELVRLN